MILYTRTFEQDALMLGWYQELLRSGDIHVTFMPSSHSLSRWLGIFRTAMLWYQADEKGINWACWFEPAYGGVMYGMWCRADLRKSRVNVLNTMFALDAALTHWKVVFGITKQSALLETHRRLGYTIVGETPVPGLWEDGSAWLVVLTREGFEAGAFYGWWQKRKQQTSERVGELQPVHL